MGLLSTRGLLRTEMTELPLVFTSLVFNKIHAARILCADNCFAVIAILIDYYSGVRRPPREESVVEVCGRELDILVLDNGLSYRVLPQWTFVTFDSLAFTAWNQVYASNVCNRIRALHC